MSWDSHKVDNQPDNLLNGHIWATDWNDFVSYAKATSAEVTSLSQEVSTYNSQFATINLELYNITQEIATYPSSFATINTQISSIFASLSPGYIGYFATSTELPTTSTSGDYSIVGATDSIWLWSASESLWVDSKSGSLSNVLRNDGTNSPISNINWASYKVTNLGNPTSNNDATSKIYVDNADLSSIYTPTPVISILSTYPTTGTSGEIYALSTGEVIKYTTEWSTICVTKNGRSIYSIADESPYFWNDTWIKYVSSVDDTGAILANGSVPLTNNWTVNDSTHSFKITNLGDGSWPTDAATISNLNTARIAMKCEPVDTIETVLNPVVIATKSNGYRYIRLVDLKVCEKYNGSWVTSDPATGNFICDKSTGYFYRFDGSSWTRFEYALDATKFNFSSLTLPHSKVTGSNIANYHPMYLRVDGTVAMTSTAMNMSSSGTAYKITGLANGTTDTDAVNMKQLNLVVSGYTDVDACSGIYNDPPTGSSVPRVIVGPSPSDIFTSYPSYVATYSLITSSWSYEFPSKGWRVLLTDNGEYYEGAYLNEANTKWVFNGTKWVQDLGAVYHDSLPDTANSTKHTRYIRNDAAGNALGMITFKPSSQTVPFTVDSEHTGQVDNLNANYLQNHESATYSLDSTFIHDPVTTQPNTIPIRDENGRIVSNYFEGNRLSVVNGLIDDRTYTSLYISGDSTECITNNNGTFNFIGYNQIEKDGIPFVSTSSSIWSSYISKTEFPISLDGKQLNYVISWDGTNWIAVNPQDVSGTYHHALLGLDADDHASIYLNTTRHDIIARHTLGSVVPHDAIANLTDVELTGLSTNQVLTYNGSKFVNAYVSAAIYNHDDLTNVAPSTKHRQFSMLDGSRMLLDSINMCNSTTYTDPTTGETVHLYLHNQQTAFYNKYIAMGLFDGQLKFEDYDVYIEHAFATTVHGITLSHGYQSISVGHHSDSDISSFKVISDDISLVSITHGNGTTGSTTFTVDGWNVYSTGSARISNTYPTGDPTNNAILGLNANYIQGKTLDDIEIGGSIDHGILRNLHYIEGTSTESDHHPQYFNGVRHNTTSTHALGTIVPHDSLDNLTNVSLGSLATNDLLIYNGTRWTNGPIGTTVAHDDTTNASSSTIHSKYIRNDITQTLITAHLDFANGIISETATVPFTLNSAINWSGPVKYLNAEMINGLTSDDLVKLDESNTFTATNIFASYSDFENVIRIPESSMLPWSLQSTTPSNREFWISTSSGFVQYRYNDTTYTLATRDGSIEGTTEQCFKINLNSSGGGIRLCDINATGVKVSNNIGTLEAVYCSDVKLGDTQSSLLSLLDSKVNTSLIGVANGVAELDENGKVPVSELPSYVSDVIDAYIVGATAFASNWLSKISGGSALTPESDKIYIIVSSGDYENKTYRWSGSVYVEISQSLALGETSSTAYRGDRGKTAYDHSQLTSGNPHQVTKSDVSLENVTNDAQLKRAAADFFSFDTKATPTYSDWLLIEDSVDSYNKKKVQISTLPLTGGAVSDAPSDGNTYARKNAAWVTFSSLGFSRERTVEDNLSAVSVLMPVIIPTNLTLSKVIMGIETLPQGANVLVDVRKNDNTLSSSSIFTSYTPMSFKYKILATTYRTRSSNVATITMASHSFATGDIVTVSGMSGTGYNGTFTLIAVTTTTISYANTGSDESSTADTGGNIAIQSINGLYQIYSGETNQPTLNSSLTSLSAYDTLWVIITQVGSTIAGAGLNVTLYFV